MTGLVRTATLLTVGGLLAASAAFAGVPDATKSSVGNNINICAHNAGTVDVRAVKTMTVRDASNAGVANATVEIRFANCVTQDIRLSGTQPHHPGALFDCPNKIVSAITDGGGVATFRIAGGANSVSGTNPPGHTTACAEVRVGSTVLGTIRVGAFDLNNTAGTNTVDLSRFLSDLFGPGAPANYRCRVDYNGDLALNVIDLSAFLGCLFGGASTATFAVCP